MSKFNSIIDFHVLFLLVSYTAHTCHCGVVQRRERIVHDPMILRSSRQSFEPLKSFLWPPVTSASRPAKLFGCCCFNILFSSYGRPRRPVAMLVSRPFCFCAYV